MTMTDLFGNPLPDAFTNMRERFGVWPVTVWPCDKSDAHLKSVMEAVGDGGAARAGCFVGGAGMYDIGASVFNPAVAQWLVSCFGPPRGGKVYDPFAGGGTRAIVCAKNGLQYRGVELRHKEVDAVRGRAHRCGVYDSIKIHCGDARQGLPEPWRAQFLLTCPPYYNLEQYRGGRNDLSMAKSYREFLDMLGQVIEAAHGHLVTGARACWVVGLHRENGRLLPLHHDVTRLHQERGYELQEEIILHQINNGAIQRVGNFDKGRRRLIRVHEYALVFSVR